MSSQSLAHNYVNMKTKMDLKYHVSVSLAVIKSKSSLRERGELFDWLAIPGYSPSHSQLEGAAAVAPESGNRAIRQWHL